jgi:hypothetical protein
VIPTYGLTFRTAEEELLATGAGPALLCRCPMRSETQIVSAARRCTGFMWDTKAFACHSSGMHDKNLTMRTASPLERLLELYGRTELRHVGAWATGDVIVDILHCQIYLLPFHNQRLNYLTPTPVMSSHHAHDTRNANGAKISPESQAWATQKIAPLRRLHSINQLIRLFV